MPSSVKPQITAGQPLDVQPGVSNIGENQAELDALRNANIDGQDVFPQSVSTRRFSAEDGAFSGNIYAGSMLIGNGGMTITSDPDLGTPNTGIMITDSFLYLIKAGVAQVTLDGTTGNATFVGAITATSGTFTGSITASTISTMSSVNFGTDVIIGGDLHLNNTNVGAALWFYTNGTTIRVGMDYSTVTGVLNLENTQGSLYLSGASGAQLSSDANILIDGNDVFVACTDGYHGALRFGTTEVLYWANGVVDITATRGLRIQAGGYIRSGAGTPEAAITAQVGSAYLRTDGGANTTLYIKESGAGSTGWVAK